MQPNPEKQREYLLNLLDRIPKSEIQLQSKCAELLYWFYPSQWKRLVTVFNNSIRANTQGVGIVPGASDCYWLQDGGKTLYLEFKFGDNKQSSKQIEWESLCISLGHRYELCYTEARFWELIGFTQPGIYSIPDVIQKNALRI